MVNERIQLNKFSFLVIEENIKNWSFVYFEDQNTKIKLGEGDTIKIILGFIKGLCVEHNDFIGEIEGVNVYVVIMLYNEYTTVYAGFKCGILEIFFQDKNANIIAKCKLNIDEINHALHQLEVLKNTAVI